jgi:hypothetical protein
MFDVFSGVGGRQGEDLGEMAGNNVISWIKRDISRANDLSDIKS